jgi:hypothetical protein
MNRRTHTAATMATLASALWVEGAATPASAATFTPFEHETL